MLSFACSKRSGDPSSRQVPLSLPCVFDGVLDTIAVDGGTVVSEATVAKVEAFAREGTRREAVAGLVVKEETIGRLHRSGNQKGLLREKWSLKRSQGLSPRNTRSLGLSPEKERSPRTRSPGIQSPTGDQ